MIIQFYRCTLKVLLTTILFLSIVEVSAAQDSKSDSLQELAKTIKGMSALKISGFIQPQWQWQDADTLGNMALTRSVFSLRRGRIKFVHRAGDFDFSLMPEITEAGVTLKEVFADWFINQDLTITVGATNRPFGYEISYSTSALEFPERSISEARLFSGEQDLGIKAGYTFSVFGLKPRIELGIFNGSDNFGFGAVSGLQGVTNKLGFGSAPIGASTPYVITKSVSDSIFRTQVNQAMAREAYLKVASDGTALSQNAKEFIGHIRVPFNVEDGFHFDVGASWSIGGITEPSDMVGEYTGLNGGLVLKKSDNPKAPHEFYPLTGSGNNALFQTNRKIFGADLQAYFSLFDFGGTIFKGELYFGQQPFYGSAYLYEPTDSIRIGTPTPSLVLKHLIGGYAMIVQNITQKYQIAVKFEYYDPNTQVEGKDFVTHDASYHIIQLAGIRPTTAFGGDLQISMMSVVFNAYLSPNVTFMFNYDHPITERYTRVDPNNALNIPYLYDANDDRLTVRLQYRF